METNKNDIPQYPTETEMISCLIGLKIPHKKLWQDVYTAILDRGKHAPNNFANMRGLHTLWAQVEADSFIEKIDDIISPITPAKTKGE